MSESQEITLYQYGGMGTLPSLSPPCLKVMLALRRLKAPHRVVDLTSPGQVKRSSPTGRVPAIEVGSFRLAESVAILDDLAGRFPEADLWPASPAERARARVWDCFVTDTMYWLGFYQRWLVPETRERLFDRFVGKGFSLKRLGLRIYAATRLQARARGQGVGLRPAAEVREAYLRALDALVDGLEGGPFLGGRDAPSRGDLAAAAHVVQLTFMRELPEVQRLLEKRSALAEHVERCFEACGLEAP